MAAIDFHMLSRFGWRGLFTVGVAGSAQANLARRTDHPSLESFAALFTWGASHSPRCRFSTFWTQALAATL